MSVDLRVADQTRFHSWVGQTVRLFDANAKKSTNFSPKDEKGPEEAFKSRRYQDLSSRFETGPAQLLMKKLDYSLQRDLRASKLFEILKKAGDITLMLWEQRVSFKCLSINSPELVKNGFQNSSELMKPHHATRINADDPTLNGHEISCVTTPAIVAYRDCNKPENRYKIWGQAVVWVGDSESTQNLSGPSMTAKVMILQVCC